MNNVVFKITIHVMYGWNIYEVGITVQLILLKKTTIHMDTVTEYHVQRDQMNARN